MGFKRKLGKSARKARRIQKVESEELQKAPHSFVIHRGNVNRSIKELVRDFRKVMEPFTASNLRVKQQNRLSDFVSIAGPLHVTHLNVFTCTEVSPYLKIGRLPQGPSITFRVSSYSLMRDVLKSLKKQTIYEKQFAHHPLVVLNNFNEDVQHEALMASMFRNLFPSINVNQIKLSQIRRCVLVNLRSDGVVDIRHYAIRLSAIGMSKPIKKLIESKIPDLSNCEDFSEFLTRSGALSESEFEDDPNSHVTLTPKLKTEMKLASNQSAIRLVELGPRLTLKLHKIEEGLFNGQVLYHSSVKKTRQELLELKKRRDERSRLKEERKRIQETNRKRKLKSKEKGKEEHGSGGKRAKVMEEKNVTGKKRKKVRIIDSK